MQVETIRTILEGARPQGWVLEPEAKRLLSAARIRVPRFGVFADKAKAIEFAEKLGFPVVAKIVSPEVVHKTDVQGVLTGIDDGDTLGAAFDRFSAHASFAGVLVEEMLDGHELIIGGRIDPQFGPVVLLGMGGIAVEVYQDVSIMMAPVNRMQVRSMLDRLKGAKTLFGFRGRPAIDEEALCRTVVAFSRLLVKIGPWIDSVDLNPVMCSPKACIVADARIMLRS